MLILHHIRYLERSVLLRLIKEVSLLVQNKAAFYRIVKCSEIYFKGLRRIVSILLGRPTEIMKKEFLPKKFH